MLINVRHDRDFQLYLDVAEQRLHNAMVPVLAAGIRLQMSRGGVNAAHYVIKRGEPVLLNHYKRVYRECFALTLAKVETTKARAPRVIIPATDTRERSRFMDAQMDWLEREAATKIADISQSMSDAIRDIVMRGVEAGQSNDAIADDLYDDIPDISANRSATIARTETHGAALDAIDETLSFSDIDVQTKTWWTANDTRVRPSHIAMHGVTVPYDEPFELDGGDMMRPGDDSLGVDAGEIVNCRCSVLFNT